MKKLILIIVLFITIVFMMLRNHYKTLRYKAKLTQQEYELLTIKSSFKKKVLYEKLQILTNKTKVPNIIIENSKGKLIKLSEIITTNTLIFYYTDNSCPPCVDNYLSILNKLQTNKDVVNICIFSRTNNVNNIKIRLLNNSNSCQYFNVKENFEIPVNYNDGIHQKPFFIILNKSLMASFPRIGWPNDSLTNPYFQRIIQLNMDSSIINNPLFLHDSD